MKISELNDQITVMKSEIDALQIQLMHEKTPWYKSPSIMISALALLFSFGTTMVSYHKSAEEDVRSARTELRSILQRLSALPRDNFELLKNYQNAPELGALTGSINQENSLLARQASEILDRIPEAASASEYYSVAYALMAASDLEKVPRYLGQALAIVSNPNIEVLVLKNFGAYYFNTGQLLNGRKKFEEALSIWVKYPQLPEYYRNVTNIFTEMAWSEQEANINNYIAANDHIYKANQIAQSLPPGPTTSQLQKQVQQLMALIRQNTPPN